MLKFSTILPELPKFYLTGKLPYVRILLDGRFKKCHNLNCHHLLTHILNLPAKKSDIVI